jgi:hypothetical protein
MHLVDWTLASEKVMKATPIAGSVASGGETFQSLKSEAIEITGMSHLEIECTYSRLKSR